MIPIILFLFVIIGLAFVSFILTGIKILAGIFFFMWAHELSKRVGEKFRENRRYRN